LTKKLTQTRTEAIDDHPKFEEFCSEFKGEIEQLPVKVDDLKR
jgi:hypothetical protein